jgi:hypothetical protein
MFDRLRTVKTASALLSVTFVLLLQGCSASGDPMPATKVDVFVLDLSSSNDAIAQLQRIQEDITNSLTAKALGVPKLTPEGEPVSGPVSTIFTFIVDAAPKAETIKLQDAADVRKLWNDEFASDTERNSKSWSQLSAEYSFYAKSILNADYSFVKSACIDDLNSKLKPKFMGDTKRGRIVNVLCSKAEALSANYQSLLSYVSTQKAPATDIYGMLSKIDRLVTEVKKEDSNSEISINIASDMQHETGDSRDTPAKLRSLGLEPAAACSAGTSDRARDGLSFDKNASLRVSGIGNAKITAEYGNALIRYWQCYFPTAEIR